MVKPSNFMTSLQGVGRGRLVDNEVVLTRSSVLQKGKDEAVQNHHAEENHLPQDMHHLVDTLKGDQGQGRRIDLQKKGTQGLELQKEILIKSRKNLNEIHGQNHQGIKKINAVDQILILVRIITMTLKESLKQIRRKNICLICLQVTVLTAVNENDFFTSLSS
jgi:hypothetical protein